MFQRLQNPLSLMPDTSSSNLHTFEADRLVPDLSARDESYTSELMEVERFVISDSPELRLVAINDPAGVGAERFRTLGSRLKRAQQRHGIKKLLVTSAVPGEGKTLMSANLAITLAMYQQRILIIDGDLRGGSLGRLFNTDHQPGLAEWSASKDSIIGTLYRAQRLPLWMLPTGKHHDNPLTILQSSQLVELMAEFSAMFDWIIIDSPPLTPFADAATLAALADAVLLVTRQGVTPKKLLREALKSIDGSRIIATVLNEATVKDQQYYYRYYQQASRHISGGARLTDAQHSPTENK
jgi:capsular exopolysaccharide synthesis family protein